LAEAGTEVSAKPSATRVTVVVYAEEHYEELSLSRSDSWAACSNRPGVTWIDVTGLDSAWPLQEATSSFSLHPLIEEDILNTNSRPKIDHFANYVFVVLKSLTVDPNQSDVLHGQVSLVLGPDYVLSFHDLNHDMFAPIRERLRTGRGRIRTLGPDYLLHALIDLVVDKYIDTLEYLGDKLEVLEDQVVELPKRETLLQIHEMKRELVLMRRSVWPLREVVSSLTRRESTLISDATIIYFRDVYDHAYQAIDTIETYRDMVSGMLDIYLSSTSNRLNEIMKVLTMVSTVFIPLTFIAGVYGMNFLYMPELKWRYGYPMVLFVMLLTLLGMLAFFRKKGWL